MAQSLQDSNIEILSPQSRDDLTGEEVVISGISGLFPNSKNVKEFMENLYNKVDMVTKDEPHFDHADLPQYTGKVSGLEKFDAQFFRVTHTQADSLEAMCRKLMEQTYCAMYDAGVNPLSFKGEKVGVFAASSNIERGKLLISNVKTNPFILTGSCKNMFANRISYWLDAKGTSFCVDDPSSSMVCMEHALTCIKTGICDSAIIASGELTCDPILCVNYRTAGILCLDGKTKCFDKHGDGCAKSQTIGVLFLQKAKDAKRIYAEIRAAGLEYCLKNGDDLNQTREPTQIVSFLKDLYIKSGVPINEVEYVEAHGAARPDADANELEAIGEMFGKEKPVKVGCVKSNMGDSQPANGVCAVIKICLAYQKGKLAGNLHYNDPLDIPAIRENKVQVLSDNTPFNRGYAAINSCCFTGTNSHVVLKGHYNPKDPNRYKTDLPRLVLVSGRQEKGVKKIFDTLKSQPMDPEFIGMLQGIYQVDTPGFTCRGYTILDTKDEQTVCLSESTEYYQGALPPLWLLYSGMGSQWPGMGVELMRIPIFAAAVEKCRQILEPKGVDIVQILTSPDETIFDNVLNCFVGIAAVQIGLTNILKQMGLVADNIIGHSVGEIGCAYYDGCFTDEEMILTAYARGLVSIQTKLIKGSMAAVGLGYKYILPLCPPEIEIACRNSFEFCTISGPEDIMKTFVADLTAKGIFAKEVRCGNIAFHSRYIQEAGPVFLKYLKEIIKNPLKRSKKWISTSWPDKQRDDVAAELCSAEYHTNNLLSPVYFEEAARLIPQKAVVIEIAPHGLMQAIVKRSHPNCIHIPLTRRGHSDPLKFLFEAFGKLYQIGYDLKVDVLYPKLQYPVSTETANLSHLVEFYHEEDWSIETYQKNTEDIVVMAARKLAISIQDDDYRFLAGHRREANIVLPEAAVIFYVWETLAMYRGVNYKELSVAFRDVHFHVDVVMDLEEYVYLKFNINKGNGYFEVTRENVMIANGYITFVSKPKKVQEKMEAMDKNMAFNDDLTSDDIYKILNLKGYCYQDDFKLISSSTLQNNSTQIKITENWIAFLDSLVQLNILRRNYDGVSVPKIIKSLTIDMIDHELRISEVDQGIIEAQCNTTTGITTCGGVTIECIIFNDKPSTESEPDVLERLLFYRYPKTGEIKEYRLVNAKPGNIDSLTWEENVNKRNDDDNLYKVCFAALSMRDIQNAVGLVETDRSFGMDFSGIDSKGGRVMGLVAEGALASTVKPDYDFLWPIPKHWTLAEAATVPLPYVLAFYCLALKGEVKPHHSVFVTGGAGALGHAIISICLSLGCTVFTSVGDLQKKRFLMRVFPNLNENHIGSIHDIGFYNSMVCHTENRRCQFVINCATGSSRELSMKYVGSQGLYLDVSDYDSTQNQEFGMKYLELDRSYININLSSVFKSAKTAEKKLLQRMMSEGIANGMVKPISHVVYSAEYVKKAFRLVSLSRHRGRTLITIRDSDIQTMTPNVISRMTYSSEGVYLVVCDETKVGIKLATHLVKRGAKKLILHMKSMKGSLGFIQIQLAIWKELGANVTISTEKLEKNLDCINFFKTTGKFNGIFLIKPNKKSALKQNSIDDDLNKFTSVVANLDNVSRNNNPELKYFVIFARTSRNKVEQLTSGLERICESRVEVGLPTLLIHAEILNDDDDELYDSRSKIQPMTIETAFRALDISLKQNDTKVMAYNEAKNILEVLSVLADIIGINIMDATFDKFPVKDLVSNEVSIEELKVVIKNNFKFGLSTEYIKKMTISSLKYLCKVRTKASTQFDSKIGAFYNFVYDDEIRATNIYAPMLTLSSLAEGIQNLHARATNILMIPGFDGHHSIFEHICESLKIRATALLLGPDQSKESIQKIALDLKQWIKKRFILAPKFYLLGYSFGVNVALEIAALLEKDGLDGVVYCLDSSPDALRVQLDAYLGKISEAQLQNTIIKHLFTVMSGQQSDSLEKYIENNNNWKDKVSKCVEVLKGFSKYSNTYKGDLIDTFYRRIHLARSYVPEMKLNSNIVLLKGIPHPNAASLPADYGLSKYANNPVHVYDINSDVASAPYDCRVANILNKLLDPALLEEFKSKNLCETVSIAQYSYV